MAKHYQLIVRGGTLVSGDDRRVADVAMSGGRIAAIEPPGALDAPADRQLDASGLYVLPGLIDGHVHVRQPGLEHKEDWLTGSRAAVMGGVTTVLDMPNTLPPTASPAAAEAKLRLAGERSFCNFGLFGLLGQQNADDPDQLQEFAGSGLIVGLKVFLGPTTGGLSAPPDSALIGGLEVARRAGLRVAFHAEDGRRIGRLESQLLAAGRRDPVAHLLSRPIDAEVSAIDRAGWLLAEAGAAGHILHLSSAEGLATVERWRDRGVDLTAEVTPHHCFLSAEDYPRLGPLLKCNPPVRDRRHAEVLLGALADGRIDVIASDHAPHAPADKRAGDIWRAEAGIAGVETALRLFLTEAVGRGVMTLEQLVRAFAESPARTWRLWPRKGTIRVGSDADLTVVDLDREGVIRGADLHGKHPLTPFDGRPTLGAPVAVVIRGEVVVDDAVLIGRPGWGRCVAPPSVAAR